VEDINSLDFKNNNDESTLYRGSFD
jgi:hypothetical protein